MLPPNVVLETVRSVRAHRLRFALTSAGIAWGVAMLTFLLASVDGFDANFARQLDEIGQRAVFLFPGTIAREHVGQREARALELELEDVERIAGLAHVEHAAPHTWIGPRLMRAGRRSKLVWTYGASAATGHIRGFEPAVGRPIAAHDVARHAKVVFLGAKVATRLFGNRPAVGRAVHVDGVPFTVIGVSRPKGEQVIYVGPADDETALIPITTAQRWFTQTETIGQIVFRAQTRETSWDAIATVRTLLAFHHRFREADRSALGQFNVEEIYQIVAPLQLGLRIFLSAASLITLFVGAVGVMNIMLVVVRERTKEIGLRKAIGGSNGAIFGQFLAEALLVTLAAGLVGALVGWAAVEAMAAAIGEGSLLNAPPLLRPRAVLTVALVLVAVGVGAGLLPAVRAARIEPAISLRAI